MARKLDKYMGTVKVGAKGQVVIPAEVREIFDIQPGDSLLLLADKKRGIAIRKSDEMLTRIVDGVFGQPHEIFEGDTDEERKKFAEEVERRIKEEMK